VAATVHYRWHELYGRSVRPCHCEFRGGVEHVHFEIPCGVVTVVLVLVLDPVACAGMTIGEPRNDQVSSHPRQLTMTLYSVVLEGLSHEQSKRVVALLSQPYLEAANDVTEDDDESL